MTLTSIIIVAAVGCSGSTPVHREPSGQAVGGPTELAFRPAAGGTFAWHDVVDVRISDGTWVRMELSRRARASAVEAGTRLDIVVEPRALSIDGRMLSVERLRRSSPGPLQSVVASDGRTLEGPRPVNGPPRSDDAAWIVTMCAQLTPPRLPPPSFPNLQSPQWTASPP